MIMGTGTVAIGCIPSYASIGIWAPILLILCRVAQGLGLGGEWGGAVLMSFESAPAHKRAFYASLPQIGLSLGLLLASGVIRGAFQRILHQLGVAHRIHYERRAAVRRFLYPFLRA